MESDSCNKVAVKIFLIETTVSEYQIYYVPLDQNGNLDLNGMKAISESGTVNYEGYYTKQIKSPIIKQGKVAIMVVIKSSGKNTSMGAEGTYDTASAKYYVPSLSLIHI
mgnify:FL=1